MIDSTWTHAASEPGGGQIAGAPPSHVGRYRIDGILGSGGMGLVYAAHDPNLGRAVALKVILGGPEARGAARLVREAHAMARVSHPNVIPVFDAGIEPDGRIYIAMERVDGQTLEEWLRAARRSPAAVLEAFAAAGRGLAAAHAAGLVHRDFKPENVLIGRDGRVRVCDFGLARAADDATPPEARPPALPEGTDGALTATGAVLGTPRYMSPEQWRGDPAGAASDQFSFCVALWRALGGEHPFDDAGHAALREAVVDGRLRPMPPKVPSRLRPILRRGLAGRPDDRHPSMEALVAALATPRARRGPLIAAAAGVTAAAVVAAVTLRTPPAAPPPAPPLAAPATVAARSAHVTSRGDVHDAAVSPDGTQLAMIARNGLIVRAMAEGSEERMLVSHDVDEGVLSWSPDGRALMLHPLGPGGREVVVVDVASGTGGAYDIAVHHVAFASDLAAVSFEPGSADLSFHRLDGGVETSRACTVPGSPAEIRSVVAHPVTGSLFVFVTRRAGGRAILMTDADCHAFRTVVAGADLISFTPDRAPDRIRVHRRTRDGQQVTVLDPTGAAIGPAEMLDDEARYLAGVDRDGRTVYIGGTSDWDLTELDRAGRTQRLTGGSVASRFWMSPDGDRVAHLETGTWPSALRVQPLSDLETRTRVIAYGASQVAWSPDGTRLAAIVDSDRFDLVVVSPRGVTSATIAWWTEPVLDVVWISDRCVGVRTASDRGYRCVDVDTAQQADLIDPGPAPGVITALRRSRDGTLAYFWAPAQGPRGIWIQRPDEPARWLTDSPSEETLLEWSTDGKALIVTAPGYVTVRSVSVADGRSRLLPGVDLAGRIEAVLPRGQRLVVQTSQTQRDVYLGLPR